MNLTPDDITNLTPEERLRLIEMLWDSLRDDDIPVTPAHRAELERSLATIEVDLADGVTWDALKTDLV